MMKRTYIIWDPTLTRSNGTRVLQKLAIALQNAGCDVYRFSYEKIEPPPDDIRIITKKELTCEIRKNAIVVYPEVIAGNPLRIQNVVRWVLYYPSRNGGNVRFYKGDMIFSFAPEFYPDAPVLTTPWLDENLFYDDGRQRVEDCVFVHKGGRWRQARELDGLREITMSYPPTREDLAELLRSVRTLYSFDSCSSVLDEAELCGANVLLVKTSGFEPYVSPYPKIVKEFPGQLKTFLERTEGFHWSGPLEGRFQLQSKLNSLWLFVVLPIGRTIRGWWWRLGGSK